MPYEFLLKLALDLLKNKWTWIILLFLALTSTSYYFYKENQSLKLDKQELVQTTDALRDSVNKKADSLQLMAVAVNDLNTDKKKIKKEYDALNSKYVILLRELHDSGWVVPIDTTYYGKKEVTVPFSGKKLFMGFKGSTTYYATDNKAKWELSLYPDTIRVQSELVFDLTDKQWKVRTTSNTEGVDLIAYSSLDQKLFREIGGDKPVTFVQANTFGLGLSATSTRLAGGFVYVFGKYEFGMNYDIINDLRKSNVWYDKLGINLNYYIF